MGPKDLVKSMNVAFDASKAIKVFGGPGIGKSEITAQVSKQRRQKHGRYFFREVNCATLNLGSTIGFVVPEDYHDSQYNLSYKRGRYTYPEYFFCQDSREPAYKFERGMLLLEEWGQAGGEIKRALATLIHQRRQGEYILPPDFDIVILSNRPEDRSGVSKEFDFLINRWMEVNLEPDLESLVEHLLERGVSETTLAFLVNNAGTVLNSKVPERQGPWCTPRSLVGVDSFVTAALSQGWSIKDPLLTECVTGLIGTGACSQYMAYVRLRDRLASYEDILADPDYAKLPAPTEPDALMLTVFSLANRVTDRTIAPVMRYMRRAPEAFMLTFGKTVLKREPDMINTAEFGRFCRENPAMMAVLSDRSF